MHGRDGASMHSRTMAAPARPARCRTAPSVASAGGCSALFRAEHVRWSKWCAQARSAVPEGTRAGMAGSEADPVSWASSCAALLVYHEPAFPARRFDISFFMLYLNSINSCMA